MLDSGQLQESMRVTMATTPNQKRRRAQRTQAFVETLTQRFPQCFTTQRDAVRPLAIGIEKAIRSRLDADDTTDPVPGWLIRQALARYTRTPAYLAAVMTGGDRIDLDGNPVEPVSEAAIKHARARRAEQKARAAERRRQQAAAKAERERSEKLQRLADHFNQ
jgi:ProP effector